MIIMWGDKGDSHTTIIRQSTNASNQYAAHLKLSMSSVSIKNKRNKLSKSRTQEEELKSNIGWNFKRYWHTKI